MESWTSSNTPLFSFAGMILRARLLDVHDGDTVTVAAEVYPGHVHRLNLRLAGIDAPEMTSKDAGVKALAELARVRLVKLLAPGIDLSETRHLTRAEMQKVLQGRSGDNRVVAVTVWCQGMDKFGRVLAEIAADEDSERAGSVLLREGLAVPYDGGTKQQWVYKI